MAQTTMARNGVKHIRRGDNVVVTKGREKGKRGKVKRILKNGRVEVEKVMMVKRHTKPTQKQPQGGILDVEGTISAANLSLFCDKCAKPRRSKKVFDENGKKHRACVSCGTQFPDQGM